jgi:hypothetical protein
MVAELAYPATAVETYPSAVQAHPFSPNPFNARTTLRYSLPAESPVTLAIFDSVGRSVATLSGDPSAGMHTISWDGASSDGTPLASGTYLYTLSAGAFRTQGKLLLLK